MTNGLNISGGVLSLGANGFSTAYRYVRQVTLPADKVMTMVQGQSTVFAVQAYASPSAQYCAWRFECGALTYSGGSNCPIPAAGFAVNKDVGY